MRSFLVLEKSKSHIKNNLPGISCSQQTAHPIMHVDLGLRWDLGVGGGTWGWDLGVGGGTWG